MGALISNRGRLTAAFLAALVLAGGAVAAVRAGLLDSEVSPIARPGKTVGAALRGFHRAEDRRMQQALSTPYVLGIPRQRLEAIAECESGGRPDAVSSDGTYRGKYQFHRGTWASVGSEGDPIRFSEPEQDRRAALLIKQSGGSGPWPICG